MSLRLVVSPLARDDINSALGWSIEHFGNAVRDAYETLISAAFKDIATDPELLGSRSRPELGPGVRSLHLRASRDHVPPGTRRILRPQHVIFFLPTNDVVHISRVLHESRDFPAQSFP